MITAYASCVRQSVVGAGSLVDMTRGLPLSTTVVVIDQAIDVPPALHAAALVFPVRTNCSPALVQTILDRVGPRSPGAIVGIGGGNVLDLAKVLSCAATEPRLLPLISERARTSGYVPDPGVARTSALALCPTTIGTGSECNGSAVLEVPADGARWKTLVSSAGFFADLAIYDPDVLHGPDWLYRQGLLEVLHRTIVPYVCAPSALPTAEAEARSTGLRLEGLLAGLSSAPAPRSDWLHAALLSASTHSGWLLKGRGAAPSPLWFLATELSVVCEVTKNVALGALLLPWADRVLGGAAQWGAAERLATMLNEIPSSRLGPGPDSADPSFRRLFALTGRDCGPAEVEGACARVEKRWRAYLPVLVGIEAESIRSLLSAAVDTMNSWSR